VQALLGAVPHHLARLKLRRVDAVLTHARWIKPGLRDAFKPLCCGRVVEELMLLEERFADDRASG
jgi:hypothetical protein